MNRYEIGSDQHVTMTDGREEILPSQILAAVGIDISKSGTKCTVQPKDKEASAFMHQHKHLLRDIADNNDASLSSTNHKAEAVFVERKAGSMEKVATGLIAHALADEGEFGQKMRQYLSENGTVPNVAGQAFAEVAPNDALEETRERTASLHAQGPKAVEFNAVERDRRREISMSFRR